MLKTLGKEYADDDLRVSYLKDNCDSVVNKGYMRRFTPEEIQAMKEQLAETSIMINDIEVEKREVSKEFKSRVDPLVNERKNILKGIKEKAEYVQETCYKFVDHDERMVGFYNCDGELIESRPAVADELQGTIFQLNRKTGTNE